MEGAYNRKNYPRREQMNAARIFMNGLTNQKI
jgi:hypothetical protein